jgi:photosystem II stability/assembly factor-like uncharacterized protein
MLVFLLAMWLTGLTGAAADAPPGRGMRYLEDLDPPRRQEETTAFPKGPTTGGNAPWQAMGPEGGYVRGLAMDPTNANVMYACTYTYPTRVFRTTDGGTSWGLLSTISDNVMCLTIDPTAPTTLYAGTYGDVRKSTDGGQTWSTFPTQTSGYAYDLAVDPVSPSTVWGAGYHYDGNNSVISALRSTNGGQNWTSWQLYTSDYGYGYAAAVDPVDNDVVYVGGYYRDGTNQPALFRTTNGGGSWALATTGITNDPVYDITIDPTNHSTVYAGVWDGTYKSTNGGTSWTNTGNGYYNYCVAIDPTAPNTLYASGGDDVEKTTDGGGSWNSTGGGFYGEYICNLIVDHSSSSRVYAGNWVGFFRTLNGGGNWAPSHTGMLGKEVADVIVAGSAPHALYAAIEDDGIYKTTVGRATWTRLGEFVDCDEVAKMAIHPQDDNTIFALTGG